MTMQLSLLQKKLLVGALQWAKLKGQFKCLTKAVLMRMINLPLKKCLGLRMNSTNLS